jgi:hypothetical protein
MNDQEFINSVWHKIDKENSKKLIASKEDIETALWALEDDQLVYAAKILRELLK